MEKKIAIQFEKNYNKLLSKGIEIIEEHGIAEVILDLEKHGRTSKKNSVNDFIFFCFTKSTKTMIAIKKLLKENMNIEALILVRSIYENYLYSQYIRKYPKEVYNIVDYSIGKSYGKYSRNKGKLFEVCNNNQIENYKEVSIFKIASEVGEDKSYLGLYSYLSEFAHPNASLIGSYINDYNFSVYKDGYKENALFLSIYCYLKMMLIITSREEFEKRSLKFHLPKLVTKILDDYKKHTSDVILKFTELLGTFSPDDLDSILYYTKILNLNKDILRDSESLKFD